MDTLSVLSFPNSTRSLTLNDLILVFFLNYWLKILVDIGAESVSFTLQGSV